MSFRWLATLTAVGLASCVSAAPVSSGATPQDPLLPAQPSLYRGHRSSDLGRAWDISQGRGVVVAVIDSGVDFAHRDLRGAWWRNPGEIPGNRQDDDHNGYVDDVHGVNLLDKGHLPIDRYGHGTAVSGLIAARQNRIGITGAAPQATIMPIKALDDAGNGDTGRIAEAVRYAVDNGAQVINLSVETTGGDQRLDDALRAALTRRVSVVASAGNSGRWLDRSPLSDLPLISVAALAADGRRLASFSNRGAVDVAAPGDELLTTHLGGGYGLFTGTSAAAAVVSGTVALMRAANPWVSPVRMRQVLLTTARRGVAVRGGRITPGLAVKRIAAR